MKRAIGAVCGGLALLLLLIIAGPLVWLGVRLTAGLCVIVPGEDASSDQLDAEQARNAHVIVAVTRQLNLSRRAAVIAIATAMQESSLRNLDHGDAAGPDSRGLFQQRLQFYGDIDPMNPAEATQAFLVRLIRIANWDTIPLADAAQAVQRSAFPHLYARHETSAGVIVDRLWGGSLSEPPCPAGTGPVYILGDSIAVGATPALRAALAGREVTVEADIGRRLDQGIAILEGAGEEIRGQAIVVALCTNYGGDQPTFATLIERTMALVESARAVVWVTCTEWSPAQVEANNAIRAAVRQHPTIRIAEWATVSTHDGNLASDGIHPTPAGALAFAALVARTVPSGSPVLAGNYTLPLDRTWYLRQPVWFTKLHHDYPAADIPVPTGTPVYAVTAGTVIKSPVGDACGNGVIIDGDDGNRYTFCHGTNPLVPQGVHVAAGDPIMISGNTGDSTGPHLHFQINLGRTGPTVCPQPALRAWAAGLPVDVRSLPTSGCTN